MISPALFALAYGLDWLIGDPSWLPHPLRWMGRMISGGERVLRKIARNPTTEFCAGLVLAALYEDEFGTESRRVDAVAREEFERALVGIGLDVLPSAANFLLAKLHHGSAEIYNIGSNRNVF